MFGNPNQPTKLFYNGPMFRYERKQKGRFRQFVQFGVEVIGVENPAIDAEVLHMLDTIYRSFGLKKLKLVINSIGDLESRKEYNKALTEHFEPVIDEFCSDCQSRLYTNPMRILDCKVDREKEAVKTAPKITDYLNQESLDYYNELKRYLDMLDVQYVEDASLVRGLDYYTHTAFEMMSVAEDFGTITTLSGGGRYNGLIEMLDGPKETGIGFALSIERLLLALEAEGIDLDLPSPLDLFIVTMPNVEEEAIKIVAELRKEGLSVDMDYMGRKLKAQMKQADRVGAKYTIVLGSDEVTTKQVRLKEMESGVETIVTLDEIVRYIKEH